ncbi:MAG: hypothetical protein QS721_05365 [Candidatus Endonucleobacter sp. (ex Gigantidas childressi)]|nr:hypothetical protein [Candidatus Endonucleobacter sp. (ex Gigantidas childressi)]
MNTINYEIKKALILLLLVLPMLIKSECQATGSTDIETVYQQDGLETVKLLMPTGMSSRAKERCLTWGSYIYEACVTAGYAGSIIQIVADLPGLSTVLGTTLLTNGSYKVLEAILTDHPDNKLYFSTFSDGAAHLIMGVYVLTSVGILYQISASALFASICLNTLCTPNKPMNLVDKVKSIVSLGLGSTLTVSAFSSGLAAKYYLIAGVACAALGTPGSLYDYASRKFNAFIESRKCKRQHIESLTLNSNDLFTSDQAAQTKL